MQKYDQRQNFLQKAISILNNEQDLLDKYLLAKIDTLCGYETDYHYLLFPKGLTDFVIYLENYGDYLLSEFLEKNAGKIVKIREKISLALIYRVSAVFNAQLTQKLNIYYKSSPEALALRIKTAWQTSQIMWGYVQDQSLDFNYYSKRTILSAIYLKVINHYLTNKNRYDNIYGNFQQIYEIIHNKNHEKSADCKDHLAYLDLEIFINNILQKLTKLTAIKTNIAKLKDLPFLRLFL